MVSLENTPQIAVFSQPFPIQVFSGDPVVWQSYLIHDRQGA
jgi:hypothetical protein